jgi:glycosyltransferase involved in cell wall biosynthesis
VNQPTIVIPCCNQTRRLEAPEFERFARSQDGFRFVLVDDGGSDGSAEVLEGLRDHLPEHFDPLRLERSRGEAEAVRRGLLRFYRACLARSGSDCP